MSWTIRPLKELPECAEKWQILNGAGTDSPLLDIRFVRDLVSEFAGGKESIATYYEREAPQAICILKRVNAFCWQTLQPPNAPLGLWISNRACEMEDLLRGLARALSPQCGIISVTQQDPDIVPRPRLSSQLATLDYIATASIAVPRSFAEYLQSRSKNFRHNVNRQKNRLKREGISARLEFLREPGDMARAVRDYSDLERASWKGRINSAVRLDEPQGRFYIKAMTSFAELGEALVYRYFFGDRLVASDLCFCRNGTLFILKTAHDETHQGLSPAHLMRLDAFAELFDKGGVRKVEFYGPLKDWHTKLTDDARQMYHVNYYRWPMVKRLHELRAGLRASMTGRATSSRAPTEDVAARDSV